VKRDFAFRGIRWGRIGTEHLGALVILEGARIDAKQLIEQLAIIALRRIYFSHETRSGAASCAERPEPTHSGKGFARTRTNISQPTL
jgi:hypothetical protein